MSVNTIVKNELENILISKNNTVLDCFRMLNKTGHHVLICLDQDEFRSNRPKLINLIDFNKLEDDSRFRSI